MGRVMSSKMTLINTNSEHWRTEGYKPEKDFVFEFGSEHQIEMVSAFEGGGVIITVKAGTQLHDELKKIFPGAT